MQKVRRPSEGDTTKKGQIVAGLQQPKMLIDAGGRDLIWSQRRIGGQTGSQFALQLSLARQEVIEQRQLAGLNGAAIGACRKKIVGVHGNKQSSIRISLGYQTNGALAHGKVVDKVDLFKRGVLAHQFNRKSAWLS